MTIHSPCFFHANDTDITYIAWFLAAFLLFSFNGSSIAPTTVNRSNRRSRFNLDVIPPPSIKLSLYNTIALLSLSPSFFIIFSQQQSLTFIIIRHAHLFRSTSWSFHFQSCFRRLSTCNETQSYTIQPRRGIPALSTVDDYPPYLCPLGISTSTSITPSQPTTTTFNCAVNSLPTYYVS